MYNFSNAGMIPFCSYVPMIVIKDAEHKANEQIYEEKLFSDNILCLQSWT